MARHAPQIHPVHLAPAIDNPGMEDLHRHPVQPPLPLANGGDGANF